MTAKINEIENKLSQYISEVQKEKTSVEKYLAQLISKKYKAGYDALLDLDQEISEFKSIISDTKKLHDELAHQYHHVSSRHLDEGVDFDAKKKLGDAVEKQEQLSSKDEVESDYIYKLLHKNISHARVLDEREVDYNSTASKSRILKVNDAVKDNLLSIFPNKITLYKINAMKYPADLHSAWMQKYNLGDQIYANETTTAIVKFYRNHTVKTFNAQPKKYSLTYGGELNKHAELEALDTALNEYSIDNLQTLYISNFACILCSSAINSILDTVGMYQGHIDVQLSVLPTYNYIDGLNSIFISLLKLITDIEQEECYESNQYGNNISYNIIKINCSKDIKSAQQKILDEFNTFDENLDDYNKELENNVPDHYKAGAYGALNKTYGFYAEWKSPEFLANEQYLKQFISYAHTYHKIMIAQRLILDPKTYGKLYPAQVYQKKLAEELEYDSFFNYKEEKGLLDAGLLESVGRLIDDYGQEITDKDVSMRIILNKAKDVFFINTNDVVKNCIALGIKDCLDHIDNVMYEIYTES